MNLLIVIAVEKYHYMLETSNTLDTIFNNKFYNICMIYYLLKFIFLRKKPKDVTTLKIKQWTISRKPKDTTNTLDKE
jgi:hypothetical protein